MRLLNTLGEINLSGDESTVINATQWAKDSDTAKEATLDAGVADIIEDIAELAALPTVALPVVRGQVYTATAFSEAIVEVVQGDTPTITFDLDADYSGWAISFHAKVNLADEDYYIDPKAGSWTDAANGVGQVLLTAADTGTVGTYYADLTLTSGSSVLTAIRYRIQVVDK